MKTLISLFVCIFLSACTMYLDAQEEEHEFKVSGGTLQVYKFYIISGDTIYKKYDVNKLVVEENDSVMYIEHFDVRKEWFVYRYVIKNGKPNLSGWQQEFDLNGQMLNERFCEFGQRDCDVMKKYNYYPGGQISSIATYKRNRLDGFTYFYYNNGQLRQTIEYKNGRMWNVLVYYDQDGNILDAGNFKDGNGTLNVYSMNGIIIQQKIFENGKLKKKIVMSEG